MNILKIYYNNFTLNKVSIKMCYYENSAKTNNFIINLKNKRRIIDSRYF